MGWFQFDGEFLKVCCHRFVQVPNIHVHVEEKSLLVIASSALLICG